MTQRTLDVLSEEECFTLLGGEMIGRFVYHDELGLAVEPVNYALDGEVIVFRVEGGSKLKALDDHVAFEVDHIDNAKGSGWSVLVRAEGRQVEMELVPALLRRMAGRFPHPWSEGHHNTWIALTARAVTGRRLGGPFVDPMI